jgi:hypothetical protein
MKSWKLAMLGLAGVCGAGIYSAPALAQPGTAASPAAEPTTVQAPYGVKKGDWHKYRKEDVYTTMTKVSRDVWHAKYSGASAQHMQELFLDGQRAYFKGNYDEAMHDFIAAERIYQKYPNAISND